MTRGVFLKNFLNIKISFNQTSKKKKKNNENAAYSIHQHDFWMKQRMDQFFHFQAISKILYANSEMKTPNTIIMSKNSSLAIFSKVVGFIFEISAK